MKRIDLQTFRALAIPRPWGQGLPGELRTDPETGVIHQVQGVDWSPASPVGSSETIYVDQAIGNDNSSGDSSNPLASIKEAIKRIPKDLSYNVVIDVADGTYTDSLSLIDIMTQYGIELIFRGKQQLATLLSGPNSGVSVGSGNAYEITVPGAGWTVDDLRGKFVVVTGGTHAGNSYPIVSNTANTLITVYQGTVWDVTDVFDIYENTVTIENSVSTDPTIYMRQGGDILFEKFNIIGDTSFRTLFRYDGAVNIEFHDCYMLGTTYGFGASGKILFRRTCYDTFTYGGYWNSMTPGNTIRWAVYQSVAISTWRHLATTASSLSANGFTLLSNSSYYGGIYLAGGHPEFDIQYFAILGRSQTNRCIVTEGGTCVVHGQLFRGLISESESSGFRPNNGFACSGVLRFVYVDFSGCKDHGIHAIGNLTINTYGLTSTVSNGGYGVVLRNGAKLFDQLGTSTLTGTLGDIDIGAGAVAWAGIPSVDANELTRIYK